jgi:hypothetical protein
MAELAVAVAEATAIEMCWREERAVSLLLSLNFTQQMHLTLLLFVRLAGGGEGAGDVVVGEEERGGAGRRRILDTGKLGSNSV